MEKKLILAMLCILISSFAAFGQQKLTGTVIDADGKPIAGATVIQKGTNNGSVTDGNGRFDLTAPVGAVLHASFMGYEPVEVTVGLSTSIEITLREEANIMDEIVVVGYGVIKKADLTGSVANVGGERLASVKATSVSQALQGAMPGVQVTRSSGLPGAEATIRVRGVTTIGDTDPLIIVDGIPGELNMDAEDIESISVLKDAASASIYGARAAAGVILVTTKRAKEGMLNIEYSGSAGFIRATDYPRTVDYKTYMYMVNETTWNEAGNIPGAEYPVYSKDLIDNYAAYNRANPDAYPIVNWRNWLMNKTAPTTKHNVSVSYGNSVIQSKISGGYESTSALYDHRKFSAISARMNNNVRINKWLSVTADASYRRSLDARPNANPIAASYEYAPLWTPVWSDGRISGGRTANIYARLHEGGFNNTWRDNITAKFALNVTPVKNLTISGIYAPNILLTKGKQFMKQIPYYSATDPNQLDGYIQSHEATSLSEARNEIRESTVQVLANYSITLGRNHNLSAMAGYEDFYSFTETLGATTDEMELALYPYLDAANINNTGVSGLAWENGYRSAFGRIGYDYAGRYLFQANIRFDYSSRFGKDYRLGTFPSFSAGWVVSKENFMKNVSYNTLSFLKFRVSWGTLGNERFSSSYSSAKKWLANYPYQAIMVFNNVLLVDSGGNVVSRIAAAQQEYNVVDKTWETTQSWNVGVDAVFLRDRLSITADYYKKLTKDMLLAVQLPRYMGYDSPQRNAGDMHTRGWDFQIEWRDRIGDFRYSISANLSDYKSTMGQLEGTVFESNGTITQTGSGYQDWFGYMADGLYLSKEDLANSPVQSGAGVGDVKYRDVSGPDGVPDGLISASYDRVMLGSSLPRYMYGGTISAGWKGIDLSIVVQGVGKHTRRLTQDMLYPENAWYNFPDFFVGRYFSYYNTAEQNARAIYPRLSTAVRNSNYGMSDHWLFNGAYFRVKNITLSYTLPAKFVNRLQMQNMKVYASVSDLFSFDNFPRGWDPEASTDGTAYIAQTYNFGVVIKF